jgi:hypothetical protein
MERDTDDQGSFVDALTDGELELVDELSDRAEESLGILKPVVDRTLWEDLSQMSPDQWMERWFYHTEEIEDDFLMGSIRWERKKPLKPGKQDDRKPRT